MDTNINHYSIEEIYNNVLKIDNDIDLDELYSSILSKFNVIFGLEQIEHDEKKKILTFFKDCFYKICTEKKFETTNEMDERINSFLHKKLKYTPLAVPKIEPVNTAVNTNISEYTKGEVNPLKRETIINTLIVNTKVLDNNGYTTTDFITELLEPMNNVVSLKVAGLEITNGYNNLSKNYKNFYFSIETYTRSREENKIEQKYKKEIILKEGYYNIRTFVTKITELFDADTKLSMIELIYDDLKGRVYFRIKSSPPVPPPDGTRYEFNLYFDGDSINKYVNIGWYLGYRKTKYLFIEDYIQIPTICEEIGFNPEAVLDLSGTKFFLLEVTDFNNNVPQVLIYNTSNEFSFRINDILAKIPNLSIMNTVQFEDSSDRIFKTRKYFGPVKLKKLRIRLLDEYGIVVDMGKGDMVITFEVETLDVPYKNLIY